MHLQSCCFSNLNLLFFVCLFFQLAYGRQSGCCRGTVLKLRFGCNGSSGSYIQTAFRTLSQQQPICFPCYLSQLKHLDMKAIVLGKHVRRTSFIKPKPSTLCRQMNKLEEQKSLCNLYLFFGLFFLAATPYHVIPCNFLLFFYSSISILYIRGFS